MRRFARWGPVFLLSLIWSNAGAQTQTPEPGLVTHTDTLDVDMDERVVCLGRRFVLGSTLILTESGVPLSRETDYSLDADAGCLTLLTPDTLGLGRVLIARYHALPVDLEGMYQLREDPHRRRAAVTLPGEAGPGPARGFTDAASTEGLAITGSKTFGIEVGNRRDLKLRQSLDLRLTGQITRDVSLLAILSDQDIPFQPEGNTAELSDLDRVLVQLESPRAGATLGDLSLETPGLSFLDIRRELEGFKGEARTDEVTAWGAVASAKGEFTTREFFGEDGKQGPYRLTDRAGNDNVIVVAGSERIWVDGRLMTRGAEEDYSIDYSLGEVTFTSRNVITATSEIVVDYQFSTGRYRRRVEYASAEGDAGKWGKLRGAFFSEGDDPDQAFGGALNASEIAELAALGDSAQLSGGTEYVGNQPGVEGDYDLVPDAESGEEVFVFVNGTGDYIVAFVDVGEGKGAYLLEPDQIDGKDVYTFVGSGNGAFIPRRDLPAPERRRVADLRWEATGNRGRFMVEGAFSDADGNVLSPLDDDDNQGGALLAEGTLEAVDLGKGVRVSPKFQVRRLGGDFRSPARLRNGFFAREWNLTGTEEIRDESLQKVAADLHVGNRFHLESEVGRLALADTFTAVRQKQTMAYNDSRLTARGQWVLSRDENHGSRGTLDRQGGTVTLRPWKIHPRFRGSHENRKRALGSGERHRDWEFALVLPATLWPVAVEVGAGRKLDDSLRVADDSWNPVRDTRRGFGQIEGRFRDLSVLLRYEARRITGSGAGTERGDTGRLDLRHQAVRGAWNAVLTADVGTVGLRQRTKVITPDSTGFFDQFGNYVGPGAGYDVQLGDFEPEILTGRVDLTGRLRWASPGKDVSVPEFLRRVSWEGFVNLTESSSLPLVRPRYFFSPGSYLDRETTLDGRLNQRQIVDVSSVNRKLGFRLRQEYQKRIRQSPTGGGSLVEVDTEDRYSGTLRANPAPGWDAELEGEIGSRREEVESDFGASPLRDTETRSGTLRGGRQFLILDGRGRASTEVTYSREAGDGRRATGWVFRPRLQWSLAKVGRVDLRYSRTHLTESQGFVGVRGPGAPTLTEGWRLELITEVRLNRGIVLSGGLSIDQPKGLSRIAEGRTEIRGTF